MSLGSDPAKVSVWRERFARRETSEMTTSQFCTSEGISKPSFYAWRRKQGSTVFNVPANIAIYLHTAPTDMRKGIDGLSGMVRSEFSGDPLDGSLYLFVNRQGARRKIFEARSVYPRESCEVFAKFQQIYDIETRGKKMSADNRWTLRQSEAKPIWESLGAWLDSPAARALLPR